MAVEDDSLRRARERIGSVLRNKWTLERLLGVGGMAAVYAGVHRNGTRGAIKVLHSDLAKDSDVRTRFLREGYAANSIPHPGVVRVLDDDDDDGTVFLVMELLEGESIETRSARHGGKLPPNEVLSLADHVLDVLTAAHRAGVVHRDIKPENLFLTSNGQIKLLDFGIARLREAPRSGSGTQPGATMGTVVYMAPEQARGRWNDVDARTDLFAVGATMFNLISGRFVHEADTQNEQLLAAMSHRANSLATVAPDAPASVVEVVDRALAYEKDARYVDAAAMQNAVRLAYHGLLGKPITTAPRLLIPADVPLDPVTPRGSTTGGRLPPGLSRTTLGRYLGQHRVSAFAVGAGVVALALTVFLMRRASDTIPPTPSASGHAPIEGPGAAAGAPVRVESPPSEPAATNAPHVLSPSDLPPAEPESTTRTAKPRTTLTGQNTPRAPESATKLAPIASPEPGKTPVPPPQPSASIPKHPPRGDVLDQQW